MIDKNILNNLTGQEIKELISENKVTLEQLDASYLRKLMDSETDMLCVGKGDVDLICRCSDLLDERAPNPMSNDEFSKIIEKSKNEHIVIADEDTSNNYVPKMHCVLKRIALVSAVILVLIASAVAVASAFGFDVCKYISEIVRESVGSGSNIDKFTFYHNGEVKKYTSLEDMIKKENLDILYPTRWPDGVKMTKIYISTDINGNDILQIFTDDVNVNINIQLASKPLTTSNSDIYEYNGIMFYFGNAELCSASCYYNENLYTITANNRDELMLIIENLKE